MKKNYMNMAILLLCISTPTLATDDDSIVVTATRTAQTADQTLASVTVITREDIERQQAQSMQELLRNVPGLNITNNGGPGKTTSVFLRGTESDHVLVLINGIKTGSATLGTTSFQDIPVEQIERIEIVRGPRSSLYGSEAIGGVIQIFTRKGTKQLSTFANVGGGSFDTTKTSAGISGGVNNSWFDISASYHNTHGFNACNGQPSPGGAGCFTNEPDDDGYRNLSGSVRAGHRFQDNLELEFHALSTNSEVQYDGSFVNEGESDQHVYGGILHYSPLAMWDMSLAAGNSKDKTDNFKDGVFQTHFETKRDTLSWQNDLTVSDNQVVTLGLDYLDDTVNSTTAYTQTSRDNTGLFAQYQGAYSQHDVQLSLRQDDNEQFGRHNTGSAAWGYAMNKALRVTASYGTAFKAPTFNELYFPGFGVATLQPEESQSIEAGLVGKQKWGNWQLNVYETLVDNLIAFDASAGAPANINKARLRGLETIITTTLYGWLIHSNLTLLDPENQSAGANNGNDLPRRAKESLNFDIDKDFGEYTFGASLHAEGKRYDDLNNSRKLGGYAIVNLRSVYSISSELKIAAKIENLLDKDYETASYYNQPGRSWFLTLQYKH